MIASAIRKLHTANARTGKWPFEAGSGSGLGRSVDASRFKPDIQKHTLHAIRVLPVDMPP